jgi:predicted RNase H-like HicB family nuclease
MKYHFKIHKEGDGFWGECLEIPGCVTQGDSREELFGNMQEAINTCLEESKESSYLEVLPNEAIKATVSVVEVPVDPSIAFGFLVRYNRIKQGLTQKKAALQLGLKNIFSYQRLEKRCNATLEMMARVVRVFPEFSVKSVFG